MADKDQPALRRAVARCVGWEWRSPGVPDDYPFTYEIFQCAQDRDGKERLANTRPLSLDDVFEACIEVGYKAFSLKYGEWKPRCNLWRADIGSGEPCFAYGDTAVEALARALCDACGVEVEG